jgi:hypothetical protein
MVTSHTSQRKTVDQVIASVTVRGLRWANDGQFYVSISRGRWAMHVFTDSKVALRDAVTRPSKRLSSGEVVHAMKKYRALRAELNRRRAKEQMEQEEKALSDTGAGTVTEGTILKRLRTRERAVGSDLSDLD